MKHRKHWLDIRLFFTGFILSVVFFGFLLGMLLVNYHISQAGTLDYTPIFSVENTNRKVTIRIVGGKIYLDWEIYRQIEPTLQKLSVFLPPRLRAFAASWNQLRIWRGQRFPWPPGPAPGFSGDKTG